MSSRVMPKDWRRRLLFAALAVYFTGLGFLGGLVTDRMRFDAERNRVLARYTQAVQQWHESLMALERSTQGGTRP